MRLKVSKEAILITFCSVATLVKVVMIDFDPPKWGIAFYQPIDELYYSYIAFNLYETGTLFNGDKIQVFGNPWLSNLITYLTLNIFGKTYMGLRFSSIIFALISVFIFWRITRKVIVDFRVRAAILFLFVINYPMTLASLIVEPSIARMAMSLFTFYLLLSYNEKKARSNYSLFFISFIVASGVLFTYPTNAYLIPFMVFVLIFTDVKSNRLIPDALVSLRNKLPLIVLGIIVASIVWITFSFFLGENILEGLNRGSHYSNRVSFTLKGAIINVLNFFRTNVFILNPLFLLLFISSALGLAKKLLYRKINPPVYFILLTFFGSLALQTIFINDFPERKLIIILPFTLLTIGLFLDFFLANPNKNSMNKALWVVSLLVSLFTLLLVPLKMGKHMQEEQYIILSILLIPFLILYAYPQKKAMIYLLALIALVELNNTWKYSINEQSKNYLTTYKNLDGYNGDNLIGGMSLGFRLYNKMTSSPSLNSYLYYGEFDEFWDKVESLSSSNDKIDLSIGYQKDSIHYDRIGFEKVETILKAENSVYTQDIVLYKEKKTGSK